MDERIHDLEKRADNNDVSAQFELGKEYMSGRSIRQDYEKSVKYFTLAAEQGLFRAQNHLGAYYMVYHRDFKNALYWFDRAAKEHPDMPISYRIFGPIYLLGLGVERDVKKAAVFFAQSFNKNKPTTESDIKQNMPNLIRFSFEIGCKLGFFAQHEKKFTEAMKYYNLALEIVDGRNDFLDCNIFAKIRIAKLFSLIKKHNIAVSLCSNAKWFALRNGNYPLMATAGLQEIGHMIYSKEYDPGDAFDNMMSLLQHFQDRELSILGVNSVDDIVLWRSMFLDSLSFFK